MTCFICDKHSGQTRQPPGGYFYEDEHWMVGHFPAEQSVAGRVVVESKRHFLDFSDMTEDESRTYGVLVKKLYTALKEITGAERVYSLVTIDGVPHFHAHFIPRSSGSPFRGVEFLNRAWSCSEEEASIVARKLYDLLNGI